jgi:hypothetical protein
MVPSPLRQALAATALALAVFSLAPVSAQPNDLETLSEQFGVTLQDEIEMLGFIRSIITSADAFYPNCEAAKSGSWPDPTGEARWTSGSFAELRQQLDGCRRDYARLRDFLADGSVVKGDALDKMEDIIDQMLAEGLPEYMNELATDPRGVSYSCGAMLYVTRQCHEAAQPSP